MTGRGARRRRYAPTEQDRLTVQLLAVAGVPHETIARCLASQTVRGRTISLATLHRHYRDELDIGTARVLASAVGVLVRRLRDNDLGAACFILKCRGGWSERASTELSPETFGRAVASALAAADHITTRNAEHDGYEFSSDQPRRH